MKTATVGEIQKNFTQVLREIKAGEEIIVTRRGKPVAKIIAMGPKKSIDWPDFFDEAVEIKGKPVSEIVIENREDNQNSQSLPASGLKILERFDLCFP